MTSIPLSKGERLLWSGVPKQGIRFRPIDILFIPFSLLWGGFAVSWEADALRNGAPLFFALWGIPFVCVGLYLTVGRFFWDSYLRANTNYAVTDTRILIQTTGVRSKLTALSLNTLPQVELEQQSDGSGSLLFGTVAYQPAWVARSGWPGAQRPPMFDMIPDARSVFDLIEKTRQLNSTRGELLSR